VLLNINLTEARPEIAQVAGLRLARAQWANGDAETALATLNSVSVTTFTSLYDELRGDIAFSQADRMTARAYYQSALTALQNSDQGQASMQREGLLTMKIDSNLVDESAPIGETE
jgi:predicted negative regulator of RcsB-dependent stress response